MLGFCGLSMVSTPFTHIKKRKGNRQREPLYRYKYI
jgi:hypothetical protein